MKFLWLKFLLLGTFALWASGIAKYAHEQLEHHGKDMAVVDSDDDDDDAPISVSISNTALPKSHPEKHSHHPCPVCQMLAGMSVVRSSSPALPQLSLDCIATLAVVDRQTPVLDSHFSLPARGPPALARSI